MSNINNYNKPIGISLPPEVLKEIDNKRGDISRSRYILRLIEKGLTINNDYNTNTIY